MKILLCTLNGMLLIFNFVFSQNKTNDLVFGISGFENDQGQAVLNLFREQDDIPEKPFRILTAQIKDLKAQFTVNTIAYDSYAVIVYHDLNSNNILDHNFFLPAEPMGFSNNWQLSLFSGMPTFEKLRFDFSADSTHFTIQIE